jgi:hypothetical protein
MSPLRTAAAMLLAVQVLLVGGCQAYRPITNAGELDDSSSSRVVQVTRRNGEVSALRGAYVEKDSLIGSDESGHARLAIALGDISSLGRSEFSLRDTAVLMVGVAAASVIALYIAALVAFSHGNWN